MSSDDARGVGDWSDDEPADMSDALSNVLWALEQMQSALDDGRYRFEAVHVRADVSFLLGEMRRGKEQLARLIEQREAAARAEALREAAEAWAHSEWSNVLLPKPTPPAVPVIAYANRVGDWLRDRAVLAGQGGEGK